MTGKSSALKLAAGVAIATILFTASTASAMPKLAMERLKASQSLVELANASAWEDAEVPLDAPEAARWYRKFAEQGYAGAQHNLALIYHLGQNVPQDYAEALKWYRKAAKQGYAGSQHTLGVMYETGKGVPQDVTEAARWYRKAAEQGNAGAQNNLGQMYEDGEGVPQNTIEAVKWYRKAAELGVTQAQFNLGVAYAKGQGGIPLDFVQAHMWFNLAAAQGTIDGAALREFVAKSMTPVQITEAELLAREWVDQYRNVHQGEATLRKLGNAGQ